MDLEREKLVKLRLIFAFLYICIILGVLARFLELINFEFNTFSPCFVGRHTCCCILLLLYMCKFSYFYKCGYFHFFASCECHS